MITSVIIVLIIVVIIVFINNNSNDRLQALAADLRTRILDFGGLDSRRILLLTGGILMSIGNFPEGFSQRI